MAKRSKEPPVSEVVQGDQLDEAGIIDPPDDDDATTTEPGSATPASPDKEQSDDDDAGGVGAGDEFDVQELPSGMPPITGLGDATEDDADADADETEPEPGSATPASPDEEPPEPAADDAGEPDPVELANYWYRRSQELQAEADRLRRIAEQGGTPAPAPAASGLQGPGGSMPAQPRGGGTPSAPPAPPTAEQIAAEMGSYPDDPTVVAMTQQARRVWELERLVQAQAAATEPLRQTHQQQVFEQRLVENFTQFVMDPSQVPADQLQEVWNLYGYVRPYMGTRASNWPDALALYRQDVARRTAPAAAREAGRREGFTAAVQRGQKARVQNLAGGTRPSRTSTQPRVVGFDEAFREAQAKTGRR